MDVIKNFKLDFPFQFSLPIFRDTFVMSNYSKLFNEQRKSEKERRKNERKQESKAAKILSAILLAFIITWTPYNGKNFSLINYVF